jgi:hypothetical protein
MNRASVWIALWLAGIVAVPLASHSQSAPNLALNIEGAGGSATAPATWASFVQGAEINIDGIVTAADDGSGNPTFTPGVQTVVIYDPTYLTLVGAGRTIPAANPFPIDLLDPKAPVTFDMGGTPYAAAVYDAGTLARNAYASPQQFVTYNFQVLPNAPVGGVTQVYYSSAMIGSGTLASATGVSDGQGPRTLVSYADTASLGTTFNGGIANITVLSTVPEAPDGACLALGLGTLASLGRRKHRRY